MLVAALVLLPAAFMLPNISVELPASCTGSVWSRADAASLILAGSKEPPGLFAPVECEALLVIFGRATGVWCTDGAARPGRSCVALLELR